MRTINYTFKGWNDEGGFGVGDISIEDITKHSPLVARALEFESSGGRNRLVEQIQAQAEKNLRGKDGEELKISKKRIVQVKREVQSQKNNARGTEGQERTSCLSSIVL